MKKLLILVLAFFLSSCSTNVQTNPSFYSKYEVEQIDYLIHNGQYFNTELISAETITYSLDETGLLVDFNTDDFTIFFGIMGDLYYEYYFDDVSFSYTIDGTEKTATLSSFFITDDGEFKVANREFPFLLYATLTISDGQIFNLYFIFNDNGDPWIGNDDHPTKEEVYFTEQLHRQILDTWKQQWNQLALFHYTQINFSNLFRNIFLGPSIYTYTPNNPYNISHYYVLDWEFNPHGEVEMLYPEYAADLSEFSHLEYTGVKISDEKLNNTAAFISFTNESIDQNHLPSNEALIQSLISLQPEYTCSDSAYCSSKFDKEPRLFYQAVGWATLVLTEDFFNAQMNVLFDTEFNHQISETSVLDSGIVQSKEEKTFVCGAWWSDGPSATTSGELIKEFQFENGIAEIELVFYKNEYDYENDIYLIPTSSGLVPLPQENIADFVFENSSDFSHWTITLQENDSDLFYTIISATKIKEVRP